jgi:CCR4-NOT transcription complex subunit 2
LADAIPHNLTLARPITMAWGPHGLPALVKKLEVIKVNIDSLSEFPSLSAAQPQHQQNLTQAAWASATQRAASQTTGSRGLQQPNTNASLGIQSSAQQSQSAAQHQDNPFGSSSHFLTGGLDDFGFGTGQATSLASLTGTTQPKTGSIDEFPPLGRNANGEIGQPRGVGTMQNAAFGGPLTGSGFSLGLNQPQSMQGRSGLLGSISGMSGARPDGNRPGGLGGARDASSPMGLGSGGTGSSVTSLDLPLKLTPPIAISASRSPVDPTSQARNGLLEQDRSNAIKSGPHGNGIATAMQHMTQSSSQSTANAPPVDASQYGTWPTRNPGSLPNSGALDNTDEGKQPNEGLSSMSELDRYGLEGLLHVIREPASDQGNLAVGQELNSLGLDLQQPE